MIVRNLVVVLLLLLAGCRKMVYDDFPPFERIPVINGYINDEGIIAVHVSFTASMSLKPIEPVNNALVFISSGDVPIFFIDEAVDGWYVGEVETAPNQSFTIKVTVPGFDDITATTVIPEMPVVYNLNHRQFAGADAEHMLYGSLNFNLRNVPGKPLFYKAAIFQILDTTAQEARIVEMRDHLLLNEGLQIPLFTNELIQGNSYNMTLNYSHNTTAVHHPSQLHPIFLELKAVSRDYYLFHRSMELYKAGRYPAFSLQPIHAVPLYSNTSSGYGIFMAYSTYRSEIFYPQ